MQHNNNNTTSGPKKNRQGFTKTRHIWFTKINKFSVGLVGIVILVVFQLSQTTIRAPAKELSTDGASDDNPQLHVVSAVAAFNDTKKLKLVSPQQLSCNMLTKNSSGEIGSFFGKLTFQPNCAAQALLQDTEQKPNINKLAFVDETQLLPDLLSLFGSHKVALVGDSLTLQHFETLSKRLNLRSHWFANGSTPSRILRARQHYHLEFSNFAPAYFEPEQVGYLVATPPATPANANRHCTQLEYFKMYNLQRAKNVTQLLEFLFEESDIVIFNLGVHYRERKLYQWDMQQLFQACGVVNQQNQNQSQNTYNKNKHCLFRETLPQHTQPNKKHFDKFPTDWRYNGSDTVRGCGVFQPTVHSIVFQSRDWLTKLSETHGVPVIRVFDEFVEAHRWHPGFDCTHYCQDNMLWDIFHKKVVDVIMQVTLADTIHVPVDTEG